MNAIEAVTLHKERYPELASLPSEVLLLFAQDIAKAEKAHLDDESDRHCAVCFAMLTPEEAAQAGPSSFHHTCTAHAKYRRTFDLAAIRKSIGIATWVKWPPFWKM